MKSENSSTHYSGIARLLHWGMALIIIAGLAGVELHDFFPKDSSLRAGMMTVHFQAGLTVLALVWLRIGAVAFRQAPPIMPEPPQWQMLAAKSIKIAFYLAMLILPVLGIVMLQASGKQVNLLGIALPVFVDEDKKFSKAVREIHETIGNVMIGLITAHIAIAVWHHVVRKDNTLLRMLPSRQ
jgi:superoxide oxidase